MSIDPSEFRRVLGHFPTGVTVVTAPTGEGPVGMAIGSFASVSLDPPLVMFCPGKESSTWARMSGTDRFCVNVLGDDQADVCGVFASKSEDKFAGIEWSTRATGSPVLSGSIAWIDCEVHAIHDGGDHHIVVGLVKALSTENDTGPLLFFRGGYGRFEKL
ncbi:MAG: flavin reductase family protein [Acidimicrobiaceae bacterium]|nr:flavin reductase family protein [Acidimicrobiaceae bacterium]MXW76520.1 flavin reductase family protein [Acidimicrobiaceae bacterium]MYA73807.1 flavin reductase family protein [Acidimicrobiaceae bacterium]MYC43764.1 flavin reductase family protein [Acidimicrobiaceae bacterium]MYD06040.1 flavin reductase family protein [Acidimicrobiaceae bacterium]